MKSYSKLMIGILHPAFKGMREQFNGALRVCLQQMKEKGASESSVTLKLNITVDPMKQEVSPEGRMMDEPELKWKIGINIPMKASFTGETKHGQKMLMDDHGNFVLIDPQISIEDVLNEEETEEEEDLDE